jgi:2-methylcitrate dehydratase PrpD
VVHIALEMVAQQPTSLREASLLLGPQMASASQAALVNGTAGHALD